MAKASLRLKPEDYDKIDAMVNLKGEEYYSVVTTPFRGKFIRSIHVFHRQPKTTELIAFESLSTKIRIRGNRTDFEGSPLEANIRLYNTLIARAYDVPVGNKILGEGTPLDVSEASKFVPDVMKRRALADALGNHFSESQVSEMADDDEGPVDVTEALAPLRAADMPKKSPTAPLPLRESGIE